MMGKRDMAFGGGLFLLCLILLYQTTTFYNPPTQIAGPSLWPRILLCLLAVFSLVLACKGFRQYRNWKQQQQGDEQAKEKEVFWTPGTKRVAVAIASTVVFLIAFRYLGYAVSVLLYFVGITYILEPVKGVKPFLIRLAQALFLVVFIYLVFGKALSVRLPNGILPRSWFV